MEFEFNCEEATLADKSGFSIITSETLKNLASKILGNLGVLINEMGVASSTAQKLPTIITTFARLKVNTENQKIEHEYFKEITPLCILDFYVSEKVQRQGYGKKIFEFMLSDAKISPSQCAYDKPSLKFLGFLKKYYNLANFIPQYNNFVVFDEYFQILVNNKTEKDDLNSIKKHSINSSEDKENKSPNHKETKSIDCPYMNFQNKLKSNKDEELKLVEDSNILNLLDACTICIAEDQILTKNQQNTFKLQKSESTVNNKYQNTKEDPCNELVAKSEMQILMNEKTDTDIEQSKKILDNLKIEN